MARQQSVLRMGYFPIPPEAVSRLLEMLVPAPLDDKQRITILDPCCGLGAGVKQIAEGLGIKQEHTYCIELDEERGKATQALMPEAKVLTPCSFLGSAIRASSLSLCYVNPPFDDAGGGQGRVEEQFVQRVTPLLVPGGVLVLVCPDPVANRQTLRYWMRSWFDEYNVIEWDRSYRNYKEVFVIATKRAELADPHNRNLRDWFQPDKVKWRVPAAPGPGAVFKKNQLTQDEMEKALKDSPLRKHLIAMPAAAIPSPPLSLGAGHIALLLASGFLDGVVTDPETGVKHAVRGTARKVEEETDSQTTKEGKKSTTVRVLTERIKLVVRTVDAAGTIKTLE